MSPEQERWLNDHPKHKVWSPQGVVSMYGWTDVGWLLPNGTFAPEGKSHQWAWPTHLMSSGDTLYVIPGEAFKVGRQYMIA